MRRHVLTSFLVLLMAGGKIAAQTGTIMGFVRDQQTQEPLPSANIQILGTQRGAATSIEGRFMFEEIPVGTYELRASLVGYQALIVGDVVVKVGKPAEVRFQLQQSPVGLEEVEATGSYFRTTPDAVVSIQRLSYEEIRRSPGGFEDVVRAISVLPGVAQAAPGRNDLVVRGGAPSENLFVVDNVEIPNINHFGTQGASGGPLSYINLDFVDETSFSTGGFGVRFGDRMSSVLSIDLRDGRSDRIGGKLTISASQFGANLEGPLSEDGSFLLSARRSYLDMIFKAAGFGFVPEYWDFLGKASYKVDKSNRVSFLAFGAIDDVSFFNDDAKKRFDNSRVLGTAQRQYASAISWRHLYGNGYSTLTLGRSFVNYNGVQRDSFLVPIFTNRSEESETSLRADGLFQRSSLSELSLGAQVKLVKFGSNLALPAFVSTFRDTVDVQVNDYKTQGVKGSVYAQLAQRFSDHVLWTAGVRVDYFDVIERKFSVSPRTTLTYAFSSRSSVNASVGLYHQFPSYIWLVANEENRSLSAARAVHYIAGIEHLYRSDFKIRVEVFFKDYQNYPASLDRRYLVLSNTGGGFGGSDENFASFGLDRLVSAGKGRSYGVEILAQKKLSEIPLYGLASLTFSDTRFTSLDGIERAGTFDQRVIVNLSGGYRFDERWEASAKFRFATGQPYTPFNANGTQNAAEYNSLRLKNAHSLDLRVDRRWNFATWSLIAYVDIQNIYNNKFPGQVRWNARTQRAEFNESSIGILPSIGVSAEF